MQGLRIAIVGYGIAGIASAICLRRRGHDIEHFERADNAVPGGAGMLLHPPAIASLATLGLLPDALAFGRTITGASARTAKGQPLLELDYGAYATGNFGLGIQRKVLIDLLRGADVGAGRVRYRYPITSVDAERGYLFADTATRHGPYDVIVAADGSNSALRRGLSHLVRRDQAYASAALVCLVDDPHRLTGNRVSQVYAGTRHVSVWPVGIAQADEPQRCNISINVPLAEVARFRVDDAWRALLASHRRQFASMLGMDLDASGLIPYTYRDVVLRRYTAGRVAFVGDAAHSMSPQLGYGALLALEDAAALAHSLDEHQDVASALQYFDLGRRDRVTIVQRTSRFITPFFQSNNRLLATLRDLAWYPATRIPSIARRVDAFLTTTTHPSR